MKLFVIKSSIGLIPASGSEFDKLQEAKLKEGEMYEVEIRKPRNIDFHRKYFALINLCFENQETFNNADELRAFLTMKSGYFKRIETPTGTMYLPESISFAKMDNIAFEDFYNKSIQSVLDFLGCDKDDLIQQIATF
jgi:hypothetical protein